MSTKKTITSVLVTTVAAMSLAACGGGNSTDVPAGHTSSKAADDVATETASDSPKASMKEQQEAAFKKAVADLAGSYLEDAPTPDATTLNPIQGKVVIKGDTVRLAYRACKGFGEPIEPKVGKLVENEGIGTPLAVKFPPSKDDKYPEPHPIARRGEKLVLDPGGMQREYFDVTSQRGERAVAGLAKACKVVPQWARD